MAKKLVIAVAVLIPLTLWLLKVGNFIGVDQHNQRADFNNSVVRVLSDLSDTVHSPRSFLAQFTQLDQLDESQQRGMWYLIEDMHYDFSAEIEEAVNELDEMAAESNEAGVEFIDEAIAMANSFSDYSDVYNELADVVRSKQLEPDALAVHLASAYDEINQIEDEAADAFAAAQSRFIDGS